VADTNGHHSQSSRHRPTDGPPTEIIGGQSLTAPPQHESLIAHSRTYRQYRPMAAGPSAIPADPPLRSKNFAQKGKIVESQVSTFWSNVISKWTQKVETNQQHNCLHTVNTYKHIVATRHSHLLLDHRPLYNHVNNLNYQVIEHHVAYNIQLTFVNSSPYPHKGGAGRAAPPQARPGAPRNNSST
jgi:hypothetical protein